MAKRVVCISHATGAGGETVGRIVAERLGFDYVDEQIVLRAAAKGNVSLEEVLDAEQRKTRVTRLLDELKSAGASLSFQMPSAGPEWDEQSRWLIREVIDEAAGRGDVVLVSHGASIALGPRDDVLRVLVTASPDTRERRHGSSVRDDDRGRADYLKRFYDVEREQPTHYDLVVNTDTVEETKAADLITHAALRL